ncbi:hypothetical protein CEW83_02520 [Parazoarcus communis]|uniref:Uncharacterized protein n=1 Tax=Parazoarcus communis TaxID=41977 RepID=A0A2U8GKX6_9RHOO|nr:hypothetical protein CEW83_02520 [Parazoarcus communis]
MVRSLDVIGWRLVIFRLFWTTIIMLIIRIRKIRPTIFSGSQALRGERDLHFIFQYRIGCCFVTQASAM